LGTDTLEPSMIRRIVLVAAADRTRVVFVAVACSSCKAKCYAIVTLVVASAMH